MYEARAGPGNVIAPGALIGGKYRLERKLAEGAMGAVYLAHNEVLQQAVVVKALHRAEEASNEAHARFLREARAAAKIQNEHVTRVLDFGTLPNGAAYLVMEFLEGRDLEHEVRARGPLPIAEAVGVVLQALDGLAEAHDAGIVHRDIKPANLFLTKRKDGGTTVKILDFGIAKSQDDPNSAALTHTSTMMGSPRYMPPEQLRAAKYVEPRSDLWAMGVVLYQLLTAQFPFTGEGIGELMLAVMQAPAPSPRALRPEIPPELERIILSCLEKNPAGRPVNARALAAALLPFAASPSALTLGHASDVSVEFRATATASPLAVGQTMNGVTRVRDLSNVRGRKVAIFGGAVASIGVIAALAVATIVRKSHSTVASAASAAVPSAVPATSLPTSEPAEAHTPAPPSSEANNVSPVADASAPPPSRTSGRAADKKSTKTVRTNPTSSTAVTPAPSCRIDTQYDERGQPHFRKVCD